MVVKVSLKSNMVKLLSKAEIVIAKARDRKLEVDEGIKLAKKVDTLRELAVLEEESLKKFRGETLGVIQSEIDAKVIERDILREENAILQEERIRLSAPIDLTKAWEEVRIDKLNIEAWKSELVGSEVKLIARESDVAEREETLHKKENSIVLKEALIARATTEAQKQFSESEETLSSARAQSAVLIEQATKREQEVSKRETEVTNKETSLVERETQNASHETDLTNRELALKDKYETLAKAQRFINKN